MRRLSYLITYEVSETDDSHGVFKLRCHEQISDEAHEWRLNDDGLGRLDRLEHLVEAWAIVLTQDLESILQFTLHH